MADTPERYGDDGYGPPPSEEVAAVRDEFLTWPRPYQDPDTNPSTGSTRE